MKKLLILLAILTIGCDKEENQEQVYDCECEFFSVYAGTSGAPSGGSIILRGCESEPILETVKIRGKIHVKPELTYERLKILSRQQGCID